MRYTPEQMKAIEVGEKAIDTEDMIRQGRFRTDPMRIDYIDDFVCVDFFNLVVWGLLQRRTAPTTCSADHIPSASPSFKLLSKSPRARGLEYVAFSSECFWRICIITSRKGLRIGDGVLNVVQQLHRRRTQRHTRRHHPQRVTILRSHCRCAVEHEGAHTIRL